MDSNIARSEIFLDVELVAVKATLSEDCTVHVYGL